MQKNPNECGHLNVHKEVFGGQHTGEYVCNGCGESFPTFESAIRAQEDAAKLTKQVEKASTTENRNSETKTEL